ncbi:hypothetical protein ABT56_22720 [Photobacterium aquae]|uniref:Uncharacterized protein n=1 Tax=Photobacterium aquae TaxID=1195763 RepID=A0A0J1GKQ4_9GAMM|nr:hypothetical protein [Photobacterium aquae]KLV00278.1 hypothetical protein ABT56_22720 [Photobacterium aquae]
MEVMPVRTSTNKVEGINRCECGAIRTIHRARGKRAKFLYSICDDCGTNQQTGKYWQDKFNIHYPSVEALHQAEQPEEKEVITVSVPEPITEPETKNETVTASQQEPQANPKPQQTEPEGEKPAGFWRFVLGGLVLGALTGGVVTRI